MAKKFKAFIVTVNNGIKEVEGLPIPNASDDFFYRKDIDESGRPVFIINHKPTGSLFAKRSSLKDAITDLKARLEHFDAVKDTFDTHTKLFSVRLCLFNRGFINVTMATEKKTVVSTVALAKENLLELTPDTVNSTLEQILFKHRRNNNKCTILAMDLYSSLEDAETGNNCIHSITYSENNAFVLDNLYFGYPQVA